MIRSEDKYWLLGSNFLNWLTYLQKCCDKKNQVVKIRSCKPNVITKWLGPDCLSILNFVLEGK
ncbi:MAG: hypothetical protein ACI8ZV_002645 [Chitinophagales bacterium]